MYVKFILNSLDQKTINCLSFGAYGDMPMFYYIFFLQNDTVCRVVIVILSNLTGGKLILHNLSVIL
jgi:hypothetical protein